MYCQQVLLSLIIESQMVIFGSKQKEAGTKLVAKVTLHYAHLVSSLLHIIDAKFQLSSSNLS